jgi:hypothetical protein
MSVPFTGHIVFRYQVSTHNNMATSSSRRLYCAQFTPGSPLVLSFSKAEQVGMVIELQQVLQSAKHRVWRYLLTGDESRFYYTIDHDHMWVLDGEEVPT